MWILHKETIISKTAKVCIGKDWRIPSLERNVNEKDTREIFHEPGVVLAKV